MTTEITYFLVGILIGGIIGWLLVRLKSQNQPINGINEAEIEAKYILKAIYENLEQRFKVLQKEHNSLNNDYLLVSKALSAKEQYADNLMDKLRTQTVELSKIQDQFTLQFENIANRLLEEKSQKFTYQNQTQLTAILDPLKEKIKDFEQKVERNYMENSKERVSLKEEIKHLRDLNMQLSQDANQLVNALKGDNKTQGDWGEFQLEVLLEKSGLEKGVHFQTQLSFKDEAGFQKRPDFIINLPSNKHLIIDSKVSLKAYEAYFNTEDEQEKKVYIKAHLDSLRSHIRDLSSKNYTRLYQINSPDYLLMFVPIEPALATALQEDNSIFLDALDRNIVIVTSSTLLATMRTVSYIWKQEKQKRSVLEIAKQSGLLYDKFVGFVNDLKDIGKKLDDARGSYDGAMNKLQNSPKYGDTLIGRAKRIKELGANASKELPEEF
ncbi:MAG: DNA recombination protein RmuC [Saprospiraceae bacterium]